MTGETPPPPTSARGPFSHPPGPPASLYHVISRGLDRRSVFIDSDDRTDFLSRIEKAVERVPTQILAWALMPNHFHFLVRSGPQGLAPFMRRLMSGYAVAFNRRHNRRGGFRESHLVYSVPFIVPFS
ncbi:MAG: transposase [Elusimicrobia bacterium]|nr:transposase [Elusimicrobiota bacterium]